MVVYQLDSLMSHDYEKVGAWLKVGKIGVMPSDTIYGIFTSALKETSVEKIYNLRKRSKDKPMIILISDINDLNHFNVKLKAWQKQLLEKIWPNPVSVIIPVADKKWEYLHRGKRSLAFRVPSYPILQK